MENFTEKGFTNGEIMNNLSVILPNAFHFVEAGIIPKSGKPGIKPNILSKINSVVTSPAALKMP